MAMSLWIELERGIGMHLYMTTLNLKHTIVLIFVKRFYSYINTTTIDLDNHQFTVHFETGDITVTIDMIEDYTQITSSPHHSKLLPLIEYMSIMGAHCTEQDHGLKASTTFRKVHCIGRWVQRNILSLDHTTSFNRPVLQIIHSFMTRQHTVYLNTVILHSLITNSQRTKSAKYLHPVLVTRLCRNFLPYVVFSTYDRVFVVPECITSAYNSCLHAVWTHSVQPRTSR